MMLSAIFRLISTAILVVASGAAGAAMPERSTIGIGDRPPPLIPMSWIKNGDRGNLLLSGKIYVVNFFATWCSASRQSLSTMSRLSHKYADDISVIGVVVRETEHAPGTVKSVSDFVTVHATDFSYAVAMDDPAAKPLFTAWMRASGMYATPTAFIIGRDGRLAWIGIPNVEDSTYPFEDALADAVAGEVDLNKSKIAYENTSKQIAGYLEERELMSVVEGALENMDYVGALAAMDDIISTHPDYRQRLLYPRVTALLGVDEKKAFAFIDSELAHQAATDPMNMRLVAGNLGLTMADVEGLTPASRLRALDLLQQGLEGDSDDYGRVLMFLAVARVHDMNGNIEAAINAQEAAIATARTTKQVTPEMLGHLRQTLHKLQKRS